MKKGLILIDSFKGTLTSHELGAIMQEQLQQFNIKSDYLPISDGGEGFLDTISFNRNHEKVLLDITDLDNQKRTTYFLVINDTAYVEVSLLLGFAGFTKDVKNPMVYTSKALGEVIKKITELNIKKMVIGLGGSLTNDFGLGMIEELGAKFYDSNNSELTNLIPKDLLKINRIDLTDTKMYRNLNVTIASDVTNPLFGSSGATEVFASQKGASEEDKKELEKGGFNFYAKLVEAGISDIKQRNGTGAAGGLGFALLGLFNSKIVSGINFAFDLYNFDLIKHDYDFIITGEGKVDQQSFKGKVVFEIANNTTLPIYVVSALSTVNTLEVRQTFSNVVDIYSIVPKLANIKKSLAYPKKYFNKLAHLVSKDISKIR